MKWQAAVCSSHPQAISGDASHVSFPSFLSGLRPPGIVSFASRVLEIGRHPGCRGGRGHAAVGTRSDIVRRRSLFAPRDDRQVALRLAQREAKDKRSALPGTMWKKGAGLFAHPRLQQLARHQPANQQRFLYERPTGHDPRRLRGNHPARVAPAHRQATARRRRRIRPRPEHRHLRHTGRKVRVRHDRPPHDAPLRRQLDRARRFRRTDLLRTCRQRLQRKAEPSGQRLLASGSGRQQGVRNARRHPAAHRRSSINCHAKKTWRFMAHQHTCPVCRWPR